MSSACQLAVCRGNGCDKNVAISIKSAGGPPNLVTYSREHGGKPREQVYYEALISGIHRALAEGYDEVAAFTDCEKMIRQFHGVEESDQESFLLERLYSLMPFLETFSLAAAIIPREEPEEMIPEEPEVSPSGPLTHAPAIEGPSEDSQLLLAELELSILTRAEPESTMLAVVPAPEQTQACVTAPKTELTSITESTACPICFELFLAPVFQCPNGHLICEDCLESVLAQDQPCPECRVDYRGLRIHNRVVDDLIQQWRPAQAEASQTYIISGLEVAVCDEGLRPPCMLTFAMFVEITATERAGQCIRGQLQGEGGWISLEDEQQRWAQPLHVGVYEVVYCTVKGASARINSPFISRLPTGTFLEVVETKYVTDDRRVRLRLTSGGWMSLVNTDDDFHWSRPVPLGTYRIRHPTKVGQEVSKDSEWMGELQMGSYVEVEETRIVDGEERVRARLSTGGWISLVDMSDGWWWAKPVRPGAYQMIRDATSDHQLEKGSSPALMLPAGGIVDIVETRHVPEDRAVRGRLASTGNWVSLVSTEDGSCSAKPVPLGTYKTTRATRVSCRLSKSSGMMQELDAGCFVEVVDTKYLAEEETVRARLYTGGWVTLVDAARGSWWLKPLPLGTYKTNAQASINATVRTDSGSLGELVARSFVEIVETKHLVSEKIVRARLATGGWISLLDTTDGSAWAYPLPLGTYKATSFARVVSEVSSLCGELAPECMVNKGSYVEVVETKYIPEEQRVRARLATGGWMSLVNTADGSWWAKPMRSEKLEESDLAREEVRVIFDDPMDRCAAEEHEEEVQKAQHLLQIDNGDESDGSSSDIFFSMSNQSDHGFETELACVPVPAKPIFHQFWCHGCDQNFKTHDSLMLHNDTKHADLAAC